MTTAPRDRIRPASSPDRELARDVLAWLGLHLRFEETLSAVHEGTPDTSAVGRGLGPSPVPDGHTARSARTA